MFSKRERTPRHYEIAKHNKACAITELGPVSTPLTTYPARWDLKPAHRDQRNIQ